MDASVVVLVVVVLALIVVALIVAAVVVPNRRRARLQERFGPEYERAVERSESRREAEQELKASAQERDSLQIRELSPQARARYIEDWDRVQAQFVDAPGDAVRAADSLLTQVMRERGYPVDDFERRSALVAVDYPDVVEHYRRAHAAQARHRESGRADTEDLRQSFVHYRELFAALVGDRAGDVDRDGEIDGAGEGARGAGGSALASVAELPDTRTEGRAR